MIIPLLNKTPLSKDRGVFKRLAKRRKQTHCHDSTCYQGCHSSCSTRNHCHCECKIPPVTLPFEYSNRL